MDKQLGLYKVDYEIEGDSRMKDTLWSAGILAYSSEEAVKSLADWLKKPFKIDTLSFQGPCHAVSEVVREKIYEGQLAKMKAAKKTEKKETKTTVKRPAKKKE